MNQANVAAMQRTLGYLLRLPYEILSDRVYAGLAASGFPDLRRAHSSVFRHIAASGSRVSELADRAHMTKQSMGYLVESLAGLGYLEIVPDAADGRAKLVRLTARGHKVSMTLVRLSRAVEREFGELLRPGEMAHLRAGLEDLAKALERVAGPTKGSRSPGNVTRERTTGT